VPFAAVWIAAIASWQPRCPDVGEHQPRRASGPGATISAGSRRDL